MGFPQGAGAATGEGMRMSERTVLQLLSVLYVPTGATPERCKIFKKSGQKSDFFSIQQGCQLK
jgi:hypothetical protein